MALRTTVAFFALVLGLSVTVSSQSSSVRTVEIVSEPKAIVWIDDVRYGTTGDDGKLVVKLIGAARASARVRANGFKEATLPIAPTATTVNVALSKTTDEAELAFQEAERLTTIDRPKAAEAYRRALKLRPNYPEANVGLARTLAEQGGIEEAFRAINAAIKQRPVYPEAAAVKGRLLKDTGEEARAIAEFKRAITQGRGRQPEAHTGLGMLFQERAETKIADGDVVGGERDYEEAAKNFTAAIKQIGISPDAGTIYQLLGRILEHQKKYKEAIALYQEFLDRFPDAVEAPAVRSFITQLQIQLDEQ